ncbi:hypothetical protein ACWD5Q_01975 [Streptomyces sp. NPDC002513]
MSAGLPPIAGEDGTTGDNGAGGPDTEPEPRGDGESPASNGSGGGSTGDAPPTVGDPPAPAPDDGAAPPAGAGARMAGWLRTVPGLAASAVVTTLAAAAATAVFTGAGHLWPASSKVSLSVETDPMRLDAEEDLIQLVPAARFDGSEPRDGCAGFWSWARARGGVDEGRTAMQLTVTNSGSNTVLITGMRAEVVSRDPVSHVVETACRTQGEAKVYSVDIDLDKPQPHGLYDKAGKSVPPDFTVTAGDLETFLVTARITHGAAQWKLAVDLVEDGEKRTVVVQDGTRPFTTVTRPTDPTVWELNPQSGAWTRPVGGGAPTGQPSGTS